MISPDRLRRPFGTLLALEVCGVGLATAIGAALLPVACILSGAVSGHYGERLYLEPELLMPTFLDSALTAAAPNPAQTENIHDFA